MKKLFTLIAALVLICLPLFSEEVEVDGICYEINTNDNTASVSSKDSEYSGEITIPESIVYNGKTYAVTSIGMWAFSDDAELTSIKIPNSVTSIKPFAFYKCYSLISVEIPNSVTTIGNEAFYKCLDLSTVTIPNNVNIEDDIFFYCESLKVINCKSQTPPHINSSVFALVDKYRCVLNVPIGSKEAYYTAVGWRNFQNINEVEFTDDDITNIDETKEDSIEISISDGSFAISDTENALVHVYNTNGIVIYENKSYNGENISLPTGIYIIKTTDGSAKVEL